MKPVRSILDTSFCYVPSVSTSVADTWRRFRVAAPDGFRTRPAASGRRRRSAISPAAFAIAGRDRTLAMTASDDPGGRS